MGQLYRAFTDTAIGDQPSGTTLKRNAAAGNYTRQDDGTNEVLRYRATSGGTAARGLAYDDAVCSGQTEMLAQIRDANNSVPSSGRLLLFASDGPDNEYGASLGTNFTVYRRVNGSYSALAQYEFSVPSSVYYNIRFQVTPGSPNQIKAKVWTEGDTEPAWQIETTNSNLSLSSGWAGHVGFATNDNVYYKFASFGWDGDPAPTGPVGVSEEPFLLRHNPRTNKVIPVLSSPTVTDIGANCVRPRVSKGY